MNAKREGDELSGVWIGVGDLLQSSRGGENSKCAKRPCGDGVRLDSWDLRRDRGCGAGGDLMHLLTDNFIGSRSW
jgi:hypothetical protein